MINKGIPYFPTPANFFDEEIMELLEAKFGILSSYIVMRQPRFLVPYRMCRLAYGKQSWHFHITFVQ